MHSIETEEIMTMIGLRTESETVLLMNTVLPRVILYSPKPKPANTN
jgi:hypothetical protein